MEKRKLRVLFTKNGQGNVNYKINLPTPWINGMGLTKENREVNVYFLDDRIIIKKGEIEMEKHYIIRKSFNGNIEQVFEGSLLDALSLQKEWGVEECKNYDNFDDLLKENYFGEEHYIEVSQEDYEAIALVSDAEKEEIWNRY